MVKRAWRLLLAERLRFIVRHGRERLAVVRGSQSTNPSRRASRALFLRSDLAASAFIRAGSRFDTLDCDCMRHLCTAVHCCGIQS
jgi:hypothetical protein